MILSGGTAGCVLAARLAEDTTISVLLVEAGPPNEAVPASAMPAGYGFPWAHHNHDLSIDFRLQLGPNHGLESGLEHQKRTLSPVE